MCLYTAAGHAAMVRRSEELRAETCRCNVKKLDHDRPNSVNEDHATELRLEFAQISSITQEHHQLSVLLSKADVARAPHQFETVMFGHKIRLRRHGIVKDHHLDFVIGGESEPSVYTGVKTFCYGAPFVKKFMGKEVGDVIKNVKLPNGETWDCEIVYILLPEQAVPRRKAA